MDWLDEIFKQMENVLGEEEIVELMNNDIQNVSQYHFTLGVWIRNTFLKKGSTVYNALLQAGFSHPDDMSAFVLSEFHRYLLRRR